MAYIWPTTQLDDPAAVLSLLGSFWSETYQGKQLVEAIVASRLDREQQAYQDITELLFSCSRLIIPVYHTELWQPLEFLTSQENGGDYALLKFDGSITFENNTPYRFGVPLTQPYFAWPLPAGMVNVPVITDRMTDPTITLLSGIDYTLTNGYLVFRDDLAALPGAPATAVFKNNVQVDTQLTFWAMRSQFDRSRLTDQFGYTLGLNMPSSPAFKQLINALLDALVIGTAANAVRRVWSAATGVPLVQTDGETVDRIVVDTAVQFVITDKRVYAFSPAANVTVTPGQIMNAGDSLTDALTFQEFNRGQVPDIFALALGPGFLASGFFGDLVFQNKNVPLVVTPDVDGYTEVSFEIDGWPGDVEQFFTEMHTRGVAAGKTLAMLLDQRPVTARTTQPTAGALPATINPLAFLCQNVLRHNAFLVQYRPDAMLPGGLGIAAVKTLRKILPPQTGMLVLVALSNADAPITMNEPGSPTAPGYQETQEVFLGNSFSETLNGAAMITEDVRCYQVGGHCI